jgi:hypothetical protein
MAPIPTKIEPCLMHNWSYKLWDLSYGDNILIPMPVEDFAKVFDGEVNEKVRKFVDALDRAIDGHKWFVKTSNRSPKDEKNPPIVQSGIEVLHMFANSERIADDIFSVANRKPFYTVLRSVRNIPPPLEFRCFVRNRNLIGITQYFYDKVFKYSDHALAEIEAKIRSFHEKVNKAFGARNYVFDVYFSGDLKDITLIEVNPYNLSDPCLFKNYDRLESLQDFFLVKKEEAA